MTKLVPVTKIDKLELVQMLKDECELNGIKFSVRWNRGSLKGTITLSPLPCSQFVPIETGIREFKANHLRILRQNAAKWGFTCVHALPIAQLAENQYWSSLSETYDFPTHKREAV